MKRLILTLFIVLFSTTALQAGHWEKIKTLPASFNNNYWLDIFFHPSNTNYGWVCGFNGMVLRTTDGGNTWAGSIVPGADHLESVHFATLNIGYTSGVEGLFKSTDGGVTWSDITPDPLSTSYWGCYFLNSNIGFVGGGGCGDNIQRFYRTSDGGSSWTLFQGTEFNSGLTDMMLDAAGIGYASSSGKIWKTTDFGVSWFVHASTGSNLWQEEITNIGNSFLVPTAGTTCAGGGTSATGGMRFSTDYGSTWNITITRSSMFGTFLIDQNKGWACGYDRQVYYTSNSGVTWKDMSCGIDFGSLDDIWFNSPNEGWVVGQGIWKLGPSSMSVSPQVADFGELCMPDIKKDTIWLKNLSFDDALAKFSLSGIDAVDFQLLSPNSLEEVLTPCDSMPIVLQFNPKSVGNKTAQFNIDINTTILTVQLLGSARINTISLLTPEITVNPALCGATSYADFSWSSNGVDSLRVFDQVIQNNQFSVVDILPIRVSRDANVNTRFAVNPIDTGWISVEYTAFSVPCNKVTPMKITAYGVSPIIESSTLIAIDDNCYRDTLFRIPVQNTGNAALLISSVDLSNSIANYKIIAWSSGNLYPISIEPKESDTLIVQFLSTIPGSFQLDLDFNNNDQTTARGIKSPYRVSLLAKSSFPVLKEKSYKINFGRVCLGDSTFRTIMVKNLGNSNARINPISPSNNEFSLLSQNAYILSNDSSGIIFAYSPKTKDYTYDTLNLSFEPCDEQITVYLEGFGVDNSAEIQPNFIKAFAQIDMPFSRTLTIKSNSNANQSIVSIKMKPAITDIFFSVSPALPVPLLSSKSVDFELSFTALAVGVYNFEICVEITGECPETYCIPIEISAKDRMVAIDKDSLNFGIIICQPTEQIKQVKLQNLALNTDTIVNIDLVQAGNAFRIVNPPTVPIYLKAGEELPIDVAFLPTAEGDYTATVIFQTIDPNGQTFELPIIGSFQRVQTNASKNFIQFGKIEHCLPAVFDTIQFNNVGLLDDSLEITIIANDGFEISPDKILLVPSGDSARLSIGAIIPDMLKNGKHNLNISLKSLVCGMIYTVDAEVEITKPMLVINPKTIDFGDVWAEEIVTRTISISNPNDEAKEFEVIGIEPADSGFAIDKLTTILSKDQRIDIVVRFESLIEGQHSARLILREAANCEDTLEIPLSADVPEEHYYPRFIIGDYLVEPGDTLTMYVSLDSAILRPELTKIAFDIRFDRYLFEPLEIKAVYANDVNIPFSMNKDLLSFKAEGNLAKNILKEAGDKFSILGVALLALPDSTAVDFQKIDIVANKRITAIKDNGSLKIFNYCLPRAAAGYQFMPTATIKSMIATTDKITITLDNTSPQEIHFELFDMTGQSNYEQRIQASHGENLLQLDMKNRANGAYFLIIKTQYNQSFTYKLILMR